MNDVPTYAWPVAIATIVLALIQLVKSDKIPITIPARAKPWVALGLGILGAGAAAIISGRSVLEAILTGIAGGAAAPGLFDLGATIKSPPSAPPSDQERPTDPPAQPPADPPMGEDVTPRTGGAARLALAMIFALVAFGCGAGADVMRVVRVSSEVIVRAEPCLVAQYEAQQMACLDLPFDDQQTCIDGVREAWKPIVEALGELRDARCSIEPKKCEAAK